FDWGYFDNSWVYDSLDRITSYDYSYFGYHHSLRYYYGSYLSAEVPTIPKAQFRIFPNPSSGNYTLSFPESFSGELMVYDITGALKFHQNISGQNKIGFDLNEPAGMYFL